MSTCPSTASLASAGAVAAGVVAASSFLPQPAIVVATVSASTRGRSRREERSGMVTPGLSLVITIPDRGDAAPAHSMPVRKQQSSRHASGRGDSGLGKREVEADVDGVADPLSVLPFALADPELESLDRRSPAELRRATVRSRDERESELHRACHVA